LQFEFSQGGGYLAFISPTTTTTSGISSSSSAHPGPLLLVTDAGLDAVHLVDVVGRTHAGYLASPGSIAGPLGVAACGASPLVAVSAWKEDDSGNHVVVVYRGSGAVWEAMRVIGGGFESPGFLDGQLRMPFGVRFSGDGSAICVADAGNRRVTMFRVGDGGFVRHMATRLSLPYDVEEVEGGWLVACFDSNTVEFVGDGVTTSSAVGGHGGRPRAVLSVYCSGDGVFDWPKNGPTALAVVPSLGLVVREHKRLQVFR
jgi:hypothetical protein